VFAARALELERLTAIAELFAERAQVSGLNVRRRRAVFCKGVQNTANGLGVLS